MPHTKRVKIMNNFEQKTTQSQALKSVNDLPITGVDKINLTNIINIYSWLSANDIHMNATFQDVIDLYLQEQDVIYCEKIEEILDSLE